MPGRVVLFFKKVAIPFVMLASFLFYRFFPNARRDNPVEEVVEVIIEATTGKQVDLSPTEKDINTEDLMATDDLGCSHISDDEIEISPEEES